MRTRIVKIGDSQGVQIPKPLLDKSGLEGEVQLHVEGETIVIRRPGGVRQGWAQAFQEMAHQGDDVLLDAPTPTHFDEEEWAW